MSYEAGVQLACEQYGIEKTANAGAALGALLGAGLGYYADPQHSWQAALMGAGAGGALGHGVGKYFIKNKAPATEAWMARDLPGTRRQGNTVHVDPAKDMPVQMRPTVQLDGTVTPEHVAAAAAEARRQSTGWRGWWNRIRGRNYKDGITLVEKQGAELGLSVTPSGPGVSMFSSNKERLPGMHAWVPRETIESIHRQLDMGVDPEDVSVKDSPATPLLAGAAYGGLGGMMLGRSARAGLLGAGLGAAGGLGAHLLSGKRRKMEAQEALYGVLRERADESRGTARESQSSARESIPMTVSTNVGM